MSGSSPRVVAVVQARMGSSRLPGKVLADVAGETMLVRVVTRLARARWVDAVVVATSTLPADDAVAEEAARLGVAVFRGSEDDVLDRYLGAARREGADWVVRVTADCPLVDPELVDGLVARFAEAGPDYASNSLERTYPRGLDVEVFTRAALETAAAEATSTHERVHVTPFLYQHPERFRLLSVTAPGGEDHSHLRWTVDTAEDLELARRLYRRLGGDGFGWRDALAVVRAEPELADVNRGVRQKSLEEL